MLKLVLFGALLALAAAAPQFPFYPGYHPYSLYNFSPYPYMRNPLEVPFPFAQPYYPYGLPYVPSFYPSAAQMAQQEQTADQPQAPAAAPAPAPAPVPKPPKEGIEIPVVTPQPSPLRPYLSSLDKGELSIESAKLYLTPEQQVLFEAAVAAMNPLEYAAQLDSLVNPSPKAPEPAKPAQTTTQPQVSHSSVPVVSENGSPINPYSSSTNKGELSIESAKLYLTPEQQVLFEAAVAAMNPLEYAAKLDSLRND